MQYYLRRVQKIKNGSYMISIPSNWVRSNNINQHDYLVIIEKPDHLILKKSKFTKKTATINLDVINDSMIMYMFDTYYIHGADMIKVISTKPISGPLRKSILDHANKLVGVKVYEANINSIIFEIEDDISTLNLEKFHKNINKILMLILLVLNNIRMVLNENINSNLQLLFSELFENIESINYRYRYVVRLLSRMSTEYEYNIFNSMREIVIYVLMMRDLERLTHHLNSLVSHIKTMYESPNANGDKLSHYKNYYKDIDDIINNVILIINQLSEYFVSGDLNYIHKIRAFIDEVRQKLLDAINTSSPVHEIFYEFRRILGYCIALFDDISQLYLIPSYDNSRII